MKNHFLFPYTGNKRNEVETIYNKIKNEITGIDTIVEPFCGSSAFSFYLSTLYPNKFKYILNDNDKNLIELYHIAQNPIKFNELIKDLSNILNNINKEIYLIYL